MTVNVDVSVDAWLDYTLLALLGYGALLLGYDIYTALRMRRWDYAAARPSPSRWGVRGLTPAAVVGVVLVVCGATAAAVGRSPA